MNRQRRFHIIFAVHYLRYGLLLCLVPMLQALLAFDLDSLWAALRQDAVILLACAAAALALWRATAFRLEDGAVKVTLSHLRQSQHRGAGDRPPFVLPHAGRKPYNAVFQNERLAQKLFHVSS